MQNLNKKKRFLLKNIQSVTVRLNLLGAGVVHMKLRSHTHTHTHIDSGIPSVLCNVLNVIDKQEVV